MRIAFVIYGSLDQTSGGYLYDREVVRRLRGRGHMVEVVSLPTPASTIEAMLHNFDPATRERLAGGGFDVIVQDELCHGSLALLNRRVRRQIKAPIVALVHHLKSSETLAVGQRAVVRRVEKRYLQTVHGLIVNSVTTGKTVERVLGADLPNVVARPSAAHRVGQDMSEEDLRKASDGPLRLLFVGNLIPRKNLPTVLGALRALKDVDWRLDIVGGGDLDPVHAEAMRQVASPFGDRVTFHGRVDDDVLGGLFREAHVLVNPSQYEGYGIIYLEAMAHGVIPVASTPGAPHEFITHRRDGFLVFPRDIDTLALILRELSQNPAHRQIMATAARQAYLAQPNWDDAAEAIEAFLLKLASQKAS
ncbi:MAG: glycosyltransferase family 4 protein [Sumerlaeia bacterium]